MKILDLFCTNILVRSLLMIGYVPSLLFRDGQTSPAFSKLILADIACILYICESVVLVDRFLQVLQHFVLRQL